MKIMEQNVYTASETFKNFFTWVDIQFLTFFSDTRNSGRAVCKNCKERDRKVAMVQLKVIRTQERRNAHTIHTMCIAGTDTGERKMKE